MFEGLPAWIALGLMAVGGGLLDAARAAPRQQRPDTLLTVRISDLTPRFLAFYREAEAEGADPDRRWALWRERYAFAAVPPSAQGMALARRQLEDSWDGYPALLDRIRAGAPGVRPAPEPILREVAGLLALDRPLDVEVVIFVGTGGGGAFSLSWGEGWRVALPVEQDPGDREISASHEFAHAVHARMAGMEGRWTRSVGQLVLGEGLAMHVARVLYPGRPHEDYVGGGRGWLEEARAHERGILEGVLGSIDNATPGAMDRFTLGPGPAGLPREGYYAGWVLVGHLLRQGWTLPGLARVPRGFLSGLAERAVREMLDEPGGKGPEWGVTWSRCPGEASPGAGTHEASPGAGTHEASSESGSLG